MRLCGFLSFFLICNAVVFASSPVAYASDIVPDGTSATSVTTAGSSKATIDIAPAGGNGVSHNRYSRFDVSTAGADLDNRSVKAGTIINEVTSANRSYILGPVSILGNKAHLIIANPNGITVDGGRFLNTGGVGLITGSLTTNGATPTFSVEGGDILVGSRGLSGTMGRLDLISKTIRLNGKIADERTDKQAALYLSSGSSTTTLFPTTDPASPGEWLSTTGNGQSSAQVSITLETGATLNGGSIRITANDQGAGVKVAGDHYAAKGDFWITSDGKIQIKDAGLTAKNNIFIAGREIELKSETKQTNLRAETSGIKLDALASITSQGVTYQGAKRSEVGFDSVGAVSFKAVESIALGKAGDFASTFTADDDALEFTGESSFTDSFSQFNAKTDVIFSMAGDLTLAGSKVNSKVNTQLNSDKKITVDQSLITAADSILLYSDQVHLLSGDIRRAELKAATGGVLIKTVGDVLNAGALVQGIKAIAGVADSKGGVSVITGGALTNKTLSQTNLASFFSESDLLYIDVQGLITNASGRFLSNKSIEINSRTGFDNNTAKTGNLVASNNDVTKGGGLFSNKRTRVIDHGTYIAGKEISTVTAVDTLTINAPLLKNRGGELTAHDINLTAKDILNQPVLFGRASLQRNCWLIFCKYKGSANISRDGGTIAATNKLAIIGSNSFYNVGGTLIGQSGINIKAPSISFKAQLLPNVYTRPGGLHGGLFGYWGRLFYTYDGGVISSTEGEITFKTDEETILEATTIVAENNIQSNQKVTQQQYPARLSERNESKIGWFSKAFFLKTGGN